MTGTSISVLIADDQDLVREGLRMMLDAEPDIDVVAEARTGTEAIHRARSTDPDVILMDIRMPDVNGIEATARLAGAGARARVLILTTFDLDEYVYRAMRAGASGFLLKDGTRDQLTAAVRTAAAGNALLAPAITRRLIQEFCRLPPADTAVASLAARLTARELEILRQVARGQSNAEVAAELFLAEATVKSHVARILAKLDLRDRVQLVVFAYETGIVRAGAG
ncbi:response regulator transcription factor [Nocardioides sp. KR10-350]|uniref:response regulator transcription factor n=1 Tax=Nocardioides cheoyonin TaxID=3156615 RepID=UPI0032B4BC78